MFDVTNKAITTNEEIQMIKEKLPWIFAIKSEEMFLEKAKIHQREKSMFSIHPKGSPCGYIFAFEDGDVEVAEDYEIDDYRSERFSSIEEALDGFVIGEKRLRDFIIGSMFCIPHLE